MRKYMMVFAVVVAILLSASVVSAASNPGVTIVNPVSGSTIYSDNLLISVKITTAASVKVTVTQEFKVVDGENKSVSLADYQKTDKSETASVGIGDAESFTGENSLSFYTKKVESIKPGVYKITVDTIESDKVTYTNSSLVEIKAKEENPANSAEAESQQSGASQFLQSLLKIIFKD